MEIVKTIDAPREFIFEKIIDSCLYDIEKNTKQRPKIRNLTGFKYTKTFGKNQTGQIKFDEVSAPTVYAFTTATNRNTYKTRWELHKIDDRSTDVIITESKTAKGFFQHFNDMIVSIFFGRFKKRRMIGILDAIQKAYVGK
ncbi:DUF3284 domain-containing protein [Lactococcus nasutitermitis]|uniref:DUF3284 domain-containing protein n=1 Tax=Lactococcus nasutitermitis TaxID=1652957 RepID=A0ABV9JE56_9LACT|nr:DUF3284 domain-containing protein [Lactococcus nasutitermitis]